MWYRTILAANLILPSLPGTSILKPKHKPGFHSITRSNNWENKIPLIREKGLLMSEAKGHTYGEPDLIWGTTGEPYSKDAPTVEFQISPEHLHSANIPAWGLHDEKEIDKYWENPKNHFALTRDIAPEDILQVHEPWHDKVRYILENPDALDFIQNKIYKIFQEHHSEILENPDKFYEFLKFPQEYSTAVRYLLEQEILKIPSEQDNIILERN